jgi:DNA-binding HxlR family transcriptional regulator
LQYKVISAGEPAIPVPEIDPVLHAPARLAIAVALMAAPRGFAGLQDQLGLTAGNLSTHLRKLEEAGYVAVDKVFRDRVPSTEAELTPAGRAAFDAYARTIRRYLDGTALTTTEPGGTP